MSILECHCKDKKCRTTTEYFQGTSEEDIQRMYIRVKSDNCDVFYSPKLDILTETATSLTMIDAKIALDGQIPVPRMASYSTGVYAEHIFVALDMASCFHTATMLRDPTRVPSTLFHKLTPFQLMLHHERYEMMKSTVQANHLLLTGIVFRPVLTSETSACISFLCKEAIKRNDAKACEILLSALHGSTKMFNGYDTTNSVSHLELALQYKAYRCISVLAPYLKWSVSVTCFQEQRLLNVLRQSMKDKAALGILIRSQVFPLEICLCEAVNAGNDCKQ